MARLFLLTQLICAGFAVGSAKRIPSEDLVKDTGLETIDAAQTGVTNSDEGDLCYGNDRLGYQCVDFAMSEFGTQIPGKDMEPVRGPVVFADTNLCSIPSQDLSGAIVVVSKGGCFYYDKVYNAQQMGAQAVVFYMPGNGNLHVPVYPGHLDQVTIPSVMIHVKDFDLLSTIVDENENEEGAEAVEIVVGNELLESKGINRAIKNNPAPVIGMIGIAALVSVGITLLGAVWARRRLKTRRKMTRVLEPGNPGRRSNKSQFYSFYSNSGEQGLPPRPNSSMSSYTSSAVDSGSEYSTGLERNTSAHFSRPKSDASMSEYSMSEFSYSQGGSVIPVSESGASSRYSTSEYSLSGSEYSESINGEGSAGSSKSSGIYYVH